jgi:hypothetical protein
VLIAIFNISLIYWRRALSLRRSSARGECAMSPRIMLFSELIEQERRRWMPFRRALSKENQEAFDRMFACAKPQVQAEVWLGRPWKFEAVLMMALLEQRGNSRRKLANNKTI